MNLLLANPSPLRNGFRTAPFRVGHCDLACSFRSLAWPSGFLMVRPTHEQLVTMAAKPRPTPLSGAHSVGVCRRRSWATSPSVVGSMAGGGFAGCPFLGHTRDGQILPFFGWFVGAPQGTRFARFQRRSPVGTNFHGLDSLTSGLLLLLVWQALRGQSLIHPDVQTLAGAVALLATDGTLCMGDRRTCENVWAQIPSGFDSRTISSNAKQALEG